MTSVVDDQIADIIYRLREEKGMSLRSIAEVVGVPHQTVDRTLKVRFASQKRRRKAAPAFKIELDVDKIRASALAALDQEGPLRVGELAAKVGTTESLIKTALGDDSWMLAPEPHHMPETFTDEQIAKAIHKVARKYGEPLTKAKYEIALERGEIVGPSHPRLIQRFGSWSELCGRFGYEVGRPRPYYTTKWTDEEIWEYVLRFITEAEAPAYRYWDTWRKEHAPEAPSSTMLRNRLGKWTDIYTEAVRRLIEENKQEEGAA